MVRTFTGRVAVVLLAAALSGCGMIGEWISPTWDWVVPLRVPGPERDEFFPYFVELCAVSQARPLFEAQGGAPGHGVMYLKGVCLDREFDYPRLKMCERLTSDDAAIDHGTGISVNKMFSNVNWMATPGRHLFFNGDLPRGRRLTQAWYDATLERVVELGLYDGIEIHDEYHELLGEGETVPQLLARRTIGTDLAVRFARTVLCTSLPMPKDAMETIVAYLNEQNDLYAAGDNTYFWSGYHDNCVHVLRNSLAAANVWTKRSIQVNKLKQFFNLAVPANEFINLADRANNFQIEDFGKVYGDSQLVDALLEFDWLPTRHGALIETAAIIQDNDLYDTKVRLFVLEGLGQGATNKVARMTSDARFIELEANLRFFRDRYRRILEEPKDENEWYTTARRAEVKQRYYAYIESQLTEVEAMLESLAEPLPTAFGD